MNTYSVEQIRGIEKRCIEKCGVVEAELMERAGKAALKTLKEHWPEARHLTVVCGGGNNGGDGFVLARLAHRLGVHVIVQTLTEIDQLKGAALVAAKACDKSGVVIKRWRDEVFTADVVVDAVLGIGLNGSVRDEHARLIAAINESGCPVLSLDVPSGVNADNGAVMGEAVFAGVTITFIGAKRGLVTGEALSHVGELECDDLNVPTDAIKDVFPVAHTVDYSHFTEFLLPRHRAAHKGDFGHVLVVGGDDGFQGAPLMAACAAARVGAGLVSVATQHDHAAMLNVSQPEIMVHGVSDAKDLKPLLDKATVVVIGPGLGQSKWAKSLLKEVLASDKPLVLDADALNLIAMSSRLNIANGEVSQNVLTPHPGEAARLLNMTAQDLQADRFTAAMYLQKTFGGVVALKGAGTIIDSGEDQQDICCEGNPGMASGGMGDVLSGMVGGLIAQGFNAVTATRLAVTIHARAGDMAALYGERGLLATDLLPYIHELVNP